MNDFTLLNVHKQEIFDLLKQRKIDPLHFELTVGELNQGSIRNRRYSILRSKFRKDFHFSFAPSGDRFLVVCSPGKGQRQSHLGQLDWENCIPYVMDWARTVERELNTPDPWESLPKIAENAELAVTPGTANTPLTYSEVQQIQRAIADMRRLFVATSKQSLENETAIREQMDALQLASERMGRKDWVNLAIGTVVSLALQVAASPETIKAAFEILRRAVTGIVDLLPTVVETGRQLLG